MIGVIGASGQPEHRGALGVTKVTRGNMASVDSAKTGSVPVEPLPLLTRTTYVNPQLMSLQSG